MDLGRAIGSEEQFRAAAAAARSFRASSVGAKQTAAVELVPTSMRDDSFRHPFASLICLLDAFFFGFFAWLLGFRVLGDNLVAASAAPGGGTPLFYSLEHRSESSQGFNSRLRSGAAARRRLMAVTVLLIVGVIWAQIEFWAGLYIFSLPLFDTLGSTFVDVGIRSLGLRTTLGFFAILSNIVLAILYISFLLGLQDKTSLLDLPPGALTAVFPFLLKARNPLTMVSYKWETKGTRSPFTARSLAYVLPNSWLDVRWLSPGMNVPAETYSIARGAFCLVVVVSPSYFRSPACVLETAAALLERDDTQQHTVFFESAPGVLPPAAAEVLRRHGVSVFTDPGDLVDYLSSRVYACSDVADRARLVRWYLGAGMAVPNSNLDRNLLLPATAVKTSFGVSSNGAPVLSSFFYPPAPRNAIVAGTSYISADALSLGRCSAWSVEYLLIVLLLEGLFTCLSAGNADVSIWIGVLFVAAGLMSFVFPLSIFLDPRNFHSPELLPINAAAICNSTGITMVARSAGRSRSSQARTSPLASAESPSSPAVSRRASAASFSEENPLVSVGAAAASASAAAFTVTLYMSAPQGEELNRRLRNIASFIGPFCCGLETSVVTDAKFDSSMTSRLQAISSAHIAVVVLQTREDADSWLAGPSQSWPESQTVLCASKEVLFSHKELGKFMCLLLPDAADSKAAAAAASLLPRWLAGAGVGQGENNLNPYSGFAPSLIDAIGSKIGHAFFSAQSPAKSARSASA